MLALLALLALVALLVVVSLGTQEPEPAEAESHPRIEAGQTCPSCHEAPLHDYEHRKPYTGACERCHNTTSWRDVRYTHANQDFNDNLHAVIGCSACHTEGKPAPSPECQDCHADRSPHGISGLACGMCHTVVAWPLLKGVPEDHLSLEGGHAPLTCFDCHTTPRPPNAPDRGCVDCHGTNHGGLTNCEDCHDPARGWDPVPGFDHSAFFPLVGKHTQVACAQCHVNDRFAGTPRNCSGCHEVVHTGLTDCADCHTPAGFVPSTFVHSTVFVLDGPHAFLPCGSCHPNSDYGRNIGGGSTSCNACHGSVNHTAPLARDCRACHNADLVVEHEAQSLGCNDCHESTNSRVRGAIAAGDLACEACHGAAAGNHKPLHTSKLSADCSGCHKANLIDEHAGYACATCHLSTDPDVVAAIAAGDLSCAACHGKAAGDHKPLHNSKLPSGCSGSGCHQANLIDEHTMLNCDGCHESTDPDVVAAIKAGNLACSACHGASAGDHKPLHDSSLSTNCSGAGCHQANLVDEHDELTCQGCHLSTDPDVANAISTGDLSCAACHGTAAGDHKPLHDSALSTDCTGSGCHQANLVDEHDDDCAACHESTDPNVVDAIEEGDLACSSCHPDAWGHAVHRSALAPACRECHDADLVDEHDTLTCESCHNSTDPDVVAAIAEGNLACTACHGADAASHRPLHESTLSADCSTCHEPNLIDEHSALTCATCHESTDSAVVDAIATGDRACTACHGSDAGAHRAPHTVDVSQCAACHGTAATNVVDLHASCTTCHADGVTPSFTCSTCHPEQANPDNSVIPHGHEVPAPYDANCVSSQCHVSNDASELHAATPAGCDSCHGAGIEASFVCYDCHPGQATSDGDVIFHGYDAATHTADDATEQITVFSTRHFGVSPPVVMTESCSSCHVLTLRELHGGEDSCNLCHAGAEPPRQSFDTWDNTCAQGACHEYHSDSVTPHAAFDDSEAGCVQCHDESMAVSCTSSGCHP